MFVRRLLVVTVLVLAGCESEAPSPEAEQETSACNPPCAEGLVCDTSISGGLGIGVCAESMCGNGSVEKSEACDNGLNNSNTTPDACREDCTLPRCGDGITDSDENCDTSGQNNNFCNHDCTFSACGDGILNANAGETCDDGSNNSNTLPDACRRDCQQARCGDGVKDSEEDCDDNSNDSCQTTCHCSSGYVPDDNGCGDLDECADDSHTCHTAATCTNTLGSFDCTCKTGYQGDGTTCTEVNECATNNGGCHPDANCTNTLGSFTCECKAGYAGDGVSCLNIDDCTPNPCQNGGTCSDGVNSYACSCTAGYSGTTCDTNIDECAGNPCQNNAACVDGINKYTCNCAAGYSGETCDTNIDECTPNPCQNNGACADGVNQYTCSCATGYSGTACETNIDECAGNPCQNNGTCVDGVNEYTCNCADGYSGTTCDTNIDECAGNPCQNNGTCVDGINEYTCNCADGYSGTTCDTNINDCNPNPCQNGGTCADGVNQYTCSCPQGFSGRDCTGDINDCSPNPCQNNGTCTDGVNEYTCTCSPGYSGARCNTNIDECAGSPCQNNGTCVDGINEYTCNCAAGYSGTTCDTNIDECSPNPCQNNGACVDGINEYTCNCAAGYSGTTCDTNIDECSPNPCQNNGACVDEVNEYTCNCATGYSGTTCDTDIDECSPNPCQNNGACTDGVNYYTCSCAQGYSGTTCDIAYYTDCPPTHLANSSHASTSATTGTVRLWGDLGCGDSTNTAIDCDGLCVSTENCTAWNWNTNNQHCCLKSGSGNLTTSGYDEWVTGLKGTFINGNVGDTIVVTCNNGYLVADHSDLVALAKAGTSSPWEDVIWASSSNSWSTGIENAIDGNNGSSDSGSGSTLLHTASADDDNPEVRLDLGAVQYVKTVKVYNRGGNCGASQCAERLDGAQIKTSTAEDCMSADTSTYTNHGKPHSEDVSVNQNAYDQSTSQPPGWSNWNGNNFDTLTEEKLSRYKAGGIKISGEWRDQGYGNIASYGLKLVAMRGDTEIALPNNGCVRSCENPGSQRGHQVSNDSWFNFSQTYPGSDFSGLQAGDILVWKIWVKQSGHDFKTRNVVVRKYRSATHAPGNLVTLDIGKNARCVMIDQNYKPAGETYKMINIFEIKVEGDDQKAAYTCGTDHQWNYGDQPTCTPIQTGCTADEYTTSSGNCKEKHECFTHSYCSSLQGVEQSSGANDSNNCANLEYHCGAELTWNGYSGIVGCCSDFDECLECLDDDIQGGGYTMFFCIEEVQACRAGWPWWENLGF